MFKNNPSVTLWGGSVVLMVGSSEIPNVVTQKEMFCAYCCN